MHVLEAWDKRVERVVDSGVEWEPLAGGFRFTEGPAWIPDEGALYFSDIPADTMYRWAEAARTVRPFRRPSDKANGLTPDSRGFLLVCEHGRRCVTRLGRAGTVTDVVASHFEGRRLNSPNDVIADRHGNIWFTDPTYGIRDVEMGYRAEREQPVSGVYRVSPEGHITLVAGDLSAPNGLALSPDGRILYVVDTEQSLVRLFAVHGDHLVDRGTFIEMDPVIGPGEPDGLRVNRDGVLFIAGPGGVWIVTPDAEVLGLLRTPEVTANCEIGEGAANGTSLFITASTSIYRLPLIG